jgi:hypothetical protein
MKKNALSLSICGINTLNKEDIIIYLKLLSEFLKNNADTILNLSILLSCILLYINIPKVITLILNNKWNKEEQIDRWKKIFQYIFWFFFFILFILFCYDYYYPEINTDILKTTSYFSRRTLKFCLAIILNFSSFYINYKSHGFKSWRTYLSIFSIMSTIFIASLFYSDTLSNNVKVLFFKTIELVTGLWLLCIYILEHKPYFKLQFMIPNSIISTKNEIKVIQIQDEFGPLKVSGYDSEEERIRISKGEKSPYIKDLDKEDEKRFKRKQLSWYPPTKPYDIKDPRSLYHPYHLLYKHTDYQGLWRERYKYIKGPLKPVKFSETYYDIHEKKYLPHVDKNSAEFAERTPRPVIRKKHIDYKPTHPDWPQNTPNYKQWYKTKWGEKYPRLIAKDIVDENYLEKNEKSKPKRKLIYKRSYRPKVVFPRSKEILMNNHPINKWNKYTKMKVKNNLYIIKPHFQSKLINTNIENNKISYLWERNTTGIKRRNDTNINFESKNGNQSQHEYQNKNEKKISQPKEIVYLDRMESESKYKSVYVDVDYNTGRVFIKEMPIDLKKREFELEKREYNLEKLVKFRKINSNICRIKVNYIDTPLPWYKDKKAILLKNPFNIGYEGRGKPEFIDLPLSDDNTLTIFDPDRFNFKTRQEKIEAGIRMKEGLTSNNGMGFINYVIDKDLKNNEYTSKQIKKNLKKNKPILMVEERHLPKQSKKNKIKSFFKSHTIGLFKGKSNVTKEIIEQKDKSKLELEKKKIEELSIRQDFELKVNKVEERMTPPLLRDSESESNSDSESDSWWDKNPDPYKVYWDDKLVELKKKNKNLPLIPLLEDKGKNKPLPLVNERGDYKIYPWTEKGDKNKPLPPIPVKEEKFKSIKGISSIKREKMSLSINQLIKEDLKIIRWMNGLPPIIGEDTEEEIRDEDLPVLPYKSKNKKEIIIEEYIDNKGKKELKNINTIDKKEVINKPLIQVENIIDKNGNQVEKNTNKSGIQVEKNIDNNAIVIEEQVRDNKVQSEKSIDDNIIQENKSKEKELEKEGEKKLGENKLKEERGPDYNLFNKEYDEMFPKKRPEDSYGYISLNYKLTQEEKEAAFRAYYERNADKFIRSNYNPIYPEPVDDDYKPPKEGETISSSEFNTIKEGTTLISEENISSNPTIKSKENKIENNNNDLPLWERRLNQKWNYIIRQFYYDNRKLYEPYEIQYAREFPSLTLPDSLRDLMNSCNAADRKDKDIELGNLKKEAEKEREAIIKRRAELMRHGINPDGGKSNFWRNDLVIENICSVIMDKVQNGIDYKVELLDEEAKFLRHNTINRVEVASAWERVFQGGKTEEKLDDAYYQEVARLEAISQERILLMDLKIKILTYKLEIFRHQLIRAVKVPTIEAADSMEESRITWIEDIAKDHTKQAEVYNHALDYIKRVQNKENARWCRNAAPLHIEWAEYYLSRQKPGTLNFKLFDPENADRFTLDMIDRFLKEDYDLLELEMKQEQERIKREKWRQENPEEAQKEYEELVKETEESYEAFKEEQRKFKEEDKLAHQRAIKREEEREKRGWWW